MGRLLAGALWLAGVAGPGQGPTSAVALAAAVLGVEPGQEATYTASTFRCRDGSGEPLPASAVNDEACDCPDGSDEPGTGACAGQDQTLFFCANKGSVPRRLYASRVGDGVCDCCDGSDEASLATRRSSAKCADRCAEEGAQKAQEREEKVGMLRRALDRQEEIRKEGLGTREKLQGEMDQLKLELPLLESILEVAKKAADVEREAEAAAAAAKTAAEDAAKAAVAAESPNCMWRQTEDCDPNGQREENNDKPCDVGITLGSSGFCDCDGDGVLDATASESNKERGFTCDVDGKAGDVRYCSEICSQTPATIGVLAASSAEAAEEGAAEEGAAEAAAEEEKAAEEAKPQVSEYSKWMDGAADKMGEKEEEKEEPQVSEYSKWMDGAADKMGEKEEEKEEPQDASTTEDASSTLDASGTESVTEEAPAETKEKTAVETESEAKTKASDHKDKIQELQESLDSLTADKLGFANLHNKKLVKKVAEFDYSIEFFSRASQDHTSLGTWSKWTGPRSAVFEEGTMCWGGPARKLNVNFVCGEKEEILYCSEPSRCVYEATVEHPGACEHADLQMHLEGSQVVGPKDEL